MPLTVDWDSEELAALHPGRIMPAIARAARKAGATALRDMRSEASKRVRKRKRLKAGLVSKAIVLRRPRGKDIDGGEWALDVRGTPVPLTAYPVRQTKRALSFRARKRQAGRVGGVSVEVNRGKRTLIKGAFLATVMRSGGLGGSAVGAHGGHRNVFVREGKERLPIRKILGSRPVDALLHKGEAEGVQERGGRSFHATFTRVLPMELAKGKVGA